MAGETGFENGRFRVGGVAAEPARNRLAAGDRDIAVEPKIMDLLAELAREPGAVRARAELIDRVWGVSYGGDESLTRAVSGLRRALAQLAPGETFLETVPKRGYRLVAPVSVERAAISNEIEANSAQTAKRIGLAPWAKIAAGVAAFALAASIFVFFVSSRTPARFSRVAVGDIDPVSGDLSSAAAATALRENLLKELALSGVEAVSDSRSDNAPLRVVGAFTRVEERNAVTIRIEDKASEQTLWSHQFEVGADPDRKVRHYIPWYVGSAVSCGVLGNDVGEPIRDPKLIGYFIRACNGFRDGGGFETLLHYASQALAYAPHSVAANVRYAIASAWVAGGESASSEREKLISLARRTADDLIKANPRLGQAYYARGVADAAALDWINAEKNLRKALALAPDYPYTYNMLTNVTQDLGRNSEAFDLQKRAVVSDHFSVIQPQGFAMKLGDQGRLPEAYDVIEKIRPIDPRMACSARFYIDHWWGDARAALESLDGDCLQSMLTQGQIACGQAFLKVRLGEGDARAAFEVCQRDPIFDIVHYAVVLGYIEDAVRIAMTRPITDGSTGFFFYSAMKPLRRDPRFMKIAARYGLVETWLQTNQWPDFCADPDLPYDCRRAAEEVERLSVAKSGR